MFLQKNALPLNLRRRNRQKHLGAAEPHTVI